MSTPSDQPTREDSLRLLDAPEELEKVLYAMTQPDNERLKRATIMIGYMMEEPKSITVLVQQMQNSQNAEVRQVAAIYLREQVEAFWTKIPDNIRANLKAFLLEKLFNSQEKAERIAVAAAATAVAKFALVKGEWPELLAALEKASRPDAPAELRQAAFIVWRNVLQFCGGALKSNFGKILEILKTGLMDESNPKVQVESVKAVGAIVEFLENKAEVAIVEEFVPAMVKVIEQALSRSDEDNVIEGMEVFTDLVESQVPILAKHGLELTKFMLKIAYAAGKLPLTVRKQAVNYMTWMCKSKPKTVVKGEFIQPFLALCINLVMESKEMEEDFQERLQAREENKEEKGDSGPDFVSALGIACDLMDEIFLNIPSEECFPLAVKAVQQLLGESDAQKRKTAYVMMAMMAEGCDQIISKGENLTIMVKASVKGIEDSDPIVRKCALEAITQFCTHISDEMIKYHKQVLPAVFSVFRREGEDTRVMERALSAVEMFVDCLDEFNQERGDFRIEDYLQPLMDTIGNCLKSKNKPLQVQAVAALASTAAAAKGSFAQYLGQVMQLLEQLLQIKEEDLLELRAEATQCLGAVAQAAGKELYGPHLMKYHQMVLAGIQEFDSSQLRESTFMYFSDLAGLMGDDLVKLESFQDMLYTCIMTMADDDGLMVELPDDGFSGGLPKGFVENQEALINVEDDDAEDAQLSELNDEQLQKLIEEAAQDADEDDEAEDEMIAQAVGQMKTVKLQVTTGFMEEKAAAVHCLTTMMKEVGPEFLPFVDDCWEQMMYLWDYPHQLVKMALANCVHQLMNLMIDHSLHQVGSELVATEPDGSRRYNWKQGDDSIEFAEELQEWIDHILPLWIQAIQDEDDKDVLNLQLDHFGEELRRMGPSCVKKHMEALSTCVNNFLCEKTAVHANSELANEATQDVAGKHKMVSDTVAELLGVLAEIWGTKFLPTFAKMFPNVLRWAKDSRHPHDNAMAVGCIADVASRLADCGPSVMSQFAVTTFPLALKIAQRQDVNARQNALYCIGALFLTAGQSNNLEFSQSCLRCVNTYMKFPRDGTRAEQLVRDNAVSCLGKMIRAEPEALPVGELIEPFLNGLPLTADFSENHWTYRVIVNFIQNEPNLVKPHIVRCLKLLADALPSDEVDAATKEVVAQCLNQLGQDKNIQMIVASELTQEQARVVQKCCQ